MPQPWMASYLHRQRFTVIEAATAASIPPSRLQDWLKRGAFSPLEGDAAPGAGRARTFSYADVVRIAVVAALTDPAGAFAMPIPRALHVTDCALGIAEEDRDDEHGRQEARKLRQELAAGGVYHPALNDRDPRHSWFLVAGLVDRIEPAPSRRLTAAFAGRDHIATALPHPLDTPREYLAREVTPIFATMDRELLRLRDLLPDTDGADANG